MAEPLLDHGGEGVQLAYGGKQREFAGLGPLKRGSQTWYQVRLVDQFVFFCFFGIDEVCLQKNQDDVWL